MDRTFVKRKMKINTIKKQIKVCEQQTAKVGIGRHIQIEVIMEISSMEKEIHYRINSTLGLSLTMFIGKN